MLKKATFSFCLCFVACAVIAQAQTSVCFDSTRTYIYSDTSYPLSIVNADFNLDGKIDLGVSTSGHNTVSVLLGDGAGNFSSPIAYLITSGKIYALTSADFNKDGKPDVATMNKVSNTVSILLGNGVGGFAPAINFPIGTNPWSIINADFNLDGTPDLAVTNKGVFGTVTVLLGDGTGNFPNITTDIVGKNPCDLKSADFNKDGKPDLAVGNYGSNTISILFGNGTGGFAPAVNVVVGWSPGSIGISDFNNDGTPDIAVNAWPGNGNNYCLNIMLGNGTGGFTVNNYVFTNPYLDIITSSDFNGDGNIDIGITATINSLQNAALYVLVGSGTGNFGNTPQQFIIGLTPGSITCADFNGDNKPDLATANDNPSTSSILINCTEFPKKKEEPIVIPNIFTPNGDGINDTFYVLGVSASSCIIYDRWGLTVWDWDNTNGWWAGKNKKGIACDDGSYYYIITYPDKTGKSVKKVGYIQLQR